MIKVVSRKYHNSVEYRTAYLQVKDFNYFKQVYLKYLFPLHSSIKPSENAPTVERNTNDELVITFYNKIVSYQNMESLLS